MDKLGDKVRGKKSPEGTEPIAIVLLPDGTTVVLDASDPKRLAESVELIKRAGS